MKQTFRILVADDEKEILDLVCSYLIKEGYSVIRAEDGLQALSLLEKEKVDLVILDVLMPYLDGFSTCAKIRSISNVPIIMLTAKSDERDRIHGIKIGADDYIVKPFSPKELLVRIEAMFRRTYDLNTKQESMIQMGALTINLKGRKVMLEGQIVDLTRKEYDLLLFFAKQSNQVFSREQLLDHVWGMEYQKGTLRTVDTHIKTLRYKLGEYGKMVKTVYGIGYSFGVEH
ncbi:response regulator transcription factor [Anaerobacillus sp. CMMVII]|uniref:response regulator transcription factor n=1 Tax=Anaerobacillus sp. CMMVII TaxID=2755588 RepID=UPI0021B82988|nr:response regulator transcription factor [Anaerobacillus sp. CMMVII]MCT8137555.1 response regulator transcription factor [Anaerobacillus sp. CMMVII]